MVGKRKGSLKGVNDSRKGSVNGSAKGLNKTTTKGNESRGSVTPLEEIASANLVVGDSIVTVSGTQIIPLSSITVVNLNGSGEYGDVKTFQKAQGFQSAGGNGSVITIKPKGFLVDDGKECRLIKVDDTPVEALLDKTGELIHSFQNA